MYASSDFPRPSRGDDDEEGDAGQIGIADFFAAASQPPKRKRAKYFHRRMLEVAEDL